MLTIKKVKARIRKLLGNINNQLYEMEKNGTKNSCEYEELCDIFATLYKLID